MRLATVIFPPVGILLLDFDWPGLHGHTRKNVSNSKSSIKISMHLRTMDSHGDDDSHCMIFVIIYSSCHAFENEQDHASHAIS